MKNFIQGMKNILPSCLLLVFAVLFLALTAGCETHKEPVRVEVKSGVWQCERAVQSYEEARQYNCLGDYKTVRAVN